MHGFQFHRISCHGSNIHHVLSRTAQFVRPQGSVFGAKCLGRPLFPGSGLSAVPLANGNYAAHSPFWNEGRGAATWGSTAAGVRGEIPEGNSPVGLSPPAFFGGGWVSLLADSGYIVGIRLPTLLIILKSLSWGMDSQGRAAR
ncbi:MAG: Cadherin proteinputative collagen-binding protein [Verrucomicrobiales bacterium]|nr:Cadherin proteinputative collagen-binding protein [Verrucomicrobiales bacterium]